MTPSYRIAFYVSGHGFGHSSRTIEVIRTLAALRPGASLAVRTSAPHRLFARLPATYVHVQCDTGVVQADSLHLDVAESLRRAAAFHAELPERAAAEAAYLKESRTDVVVGDIPPLAFAAAHLAGVPAVALGNFTWDWIYGDYDQPSAAELAQAIRDVYRTAALALRLPMSGGFSGLEAVTRDIPFIARRSRHEPEHVRRALGIPSEKRMLLLSFGGHGLNGLDTGALARLSNFTIVTTEPVAGLFQIPEDRLHGAGFVYEDLMRAADAVVTKPGYGIITEAIANDTAMLYTSRGHFPEYDVLVEEMPKYLRARFIEQEDLLAGRWEPALDALLTSPKPSALPALNGAEVAAEAIASLL